MSMIIDWVVGQVILAVHVITQIKVAIKILSKKKMKDDGMIERVKKEIQNLEMLEHPHIIRLYEVIETTTAIYLVTELASGGELFDLISIKGKFTENEARSLFQQIISGIDYCSARGVVHRDLKPENIFLGEGGSIKIGDFGLSNTIKDGEFLTTFCGSREYAAPEILKGVAYAGSEVDVWSSGVILYALLTGSLPFSDDNVYLLTKKVLSGKFPMPSIIPEGAQDLIRKMLQVDPIKRIKVNEIMEHPWFKKNLPPYLSISAGEELENESDDENDEVDMEVVQQMIKIDVLKKIDKQRLVQGLQTVRGKKKNALRCTYELLLDVKLNKERLAQQLEIQSATSSFSASHQSNFAFSPSMTPTPPILSTPKQGVAATSQSIVSHTPSNPAAVAAVGKRRFFLGLQNESNRLTVMRKVFITLMALNCQWQICSPYHIICRWRPLNSNHFEAANAKEWIYVGLRVYKTDDKKYYLDFQRVGGCSNTFAFMELCSMIINHLTTSRKQSGASISSANPTAIPSNEAISADPSSMI